jgi:hypothetical protein
MTILTSAEVCAVITLIVVPPLRVNEAGINSHVVADKEELAGTTATAPETSTHTSFGK